MGLSLFAGTFSSNSFVGLPAEGAFGNYHQLLAIFVIPFIIVPITCIWFIPFYKSLEIFAGLKSKTWWDGMLTTIPAFVLGAFVSYVTPPPPEEKLKGLLLLQDDRI